MSRIEFLSVYTSENPSDNQITGSCNAGKTYRDSPLKTPYNGTRKQTEQNNSRIIPSTRSFRTPGLKAPNTTQRTLRIHMQETFQSLEKITSMVPPDFSYLLSKQIHLPKRDAHLDRKTIIFDLDETLVHCLGESACATDGIVQVKLSEGRTIPVGFNIRPYALECLSKANEYFEVIIFTASLKCYADAILDHLDPSGTLISHRLYRNHCFKKDGNYIKDLRILSNRDLSDIIIIDNSAVSFAFQIDNGIPVVTWESDYKDRELLDLVKHFEELARAEDVRDVIRRKVNMKGLFKEYLKKSKSNRT